MGKTIKLSRQQVWQAKQRALGNCTICGMPSLTRSLCLDCAVTRREQRRRKIGSVKRYNSLTYRLAAQAK